MRITEKIRDKILLHLPKGYAATIAQECEVSEPTVYRALHHETENPMVVEALIRLADKTKKEKQAKQKELQRIAEQL